MSLDLFIHDGLGEERLILLIVTKSSVSDDINEDILLEFLSVLNGNLHTVIKQVWLISIDVDDWGSDNFSNFSTIER